MRIFAHQLAALINEQQLRAVQEPLKTKPPDRHWANQELKRKASGCGEPCGVCVLWVQTTSGDVCVSCPGWAVLPASYLKVCSYRREMPMKQELSALRMRQKLYENTMNVVQCCFRTSCLVCILLEILFAAAAQTCASPHAFLPLPLLTEPEADPSTPRAYREYCRVGRDDSVRRPLKARKRREKKEHHPAETSKP